MKADKLKELAPYAGIPAAIAALLMLQAGKADAYSMIMRCMIIAFGYVGAIHDLRIRKIPNVLIVTMMGAWACVTAARLLFDINSAIGPLVDAAIGFGAAGGLFLFVYLISRKGLGGGDVKFAAAAGLYLGAAGVVTAIFFGTLLAALTGLGLILFGKIGRKDMIPLAPFLCIGILLTVFLQ